MSNTQIESVFINDTRCMIEDVHPHVIRKNTSNQRQSFSNDMKHHIIKDESSKRAQFLIKEHHQTIPEENYPSLPEDQYQSNSNQHLYNSKNSTEPMPDDVVPRLVKNDYRKVISFKSLSLIALHIASLVGIFFVPFGWTHGIVLYFSTVLRGFALSAGYHRYFSHRSFSTSRPLQFLIGVLGALSMQSGPIWWASQHRYHHRYSDTEVDTHSPTRRGFFFSHMGWTLVSEVDEPRYSLVPDLLRYKELVLLEKYSAVPGILYAICLYWFGGLEMFFWGFIVSTMIIFQIAFCINSITHMYGSVRFQTGDTSKNNYPLGILALGEGFHNNHHAYDRSARTGIFWWEVDMVYYLIASLEYIGLVWNVNRPNIEKMGTYIRRK